MFPNNLSASNFWTTWLRLCVLLNNNHNNCCCLFTSRMTTTFQSNKNEKLGIGSHLQELEKTEDLQESTPKSEEFFCRGGLKKKALFTFKDKLQQHKYKDICKYISVSNFTHNPCSPVFLEQSCNSIWVSSISFFSAFSLSCPKKQLATFKFKIFQSKQQNTFTHLKEVVDGTVSELGAIVKLLS